jgi:hypothetical protein
MMEMTESTRGAAAKTQSKFDLFMDCLYEFYFENRTGPYISYGLAFVSALVYSGIGHFAFGRSEGHGRESAVTSTLTTTPLTTKPLS